MKPIRSIKNQYHGINAHLHSHWQAEGGWSGFHGPHINDLLRLLLVDLLPMGYVAEYESSLQIRRLDDVDAAPQFPESDIGIYDLNSERAKQPPVSRFLTDMPDAANTLVLPPLEVLLLDPISEHDYPAIAIYEQDQSGQKGGEPVVWIELLSPSNKGDGQDAESYREKRLKIIQSGLVFVEIDYLHESKPTWRNVADYRNRKQGTKSHPNSHPYRIAVIDPRPTIEEGRAAIVEFDVDSTIPTVAIPLNGEDVLHFDFGAAYQKTLEETFFCYRLVDYSQWPQQVERYSEADQARIAIRMATVCRAEQQEIELDQGPFPAEEITHEEAKAYLAAYTSV